MTYIPFAACIAVMLFLAFNTGVTHWYLAIPFAIYCYVKSVRGKNNKLLIVTIVATVLMVGINFTLSINPLLFPILRGGYLVASEDGYLIYDPSKLHSLSSYNDPSSWPPAGRIIPADSQYFFSEDEVLSTAYFSLVYKNLDPQGYINGHLPKEVNTHVALTDIPVLSKEYCSDCVVTQIKQGDRFPITSIDITYLPGMFGYNTYYSLVTDVGVVSVSIPYRDIDAQDEPYVMKHFFNAISPSGERLFYLGTYGVERLVPQGTSPDQRP